MTILPPATRPWRIKIVRRHAPRPSRAVQGFQTYRPCLRWEFGFSCAFCLCHEADLAPYGAEGYALMQVEHFDTQAQAPERRNEYANCFLACRRCNLERGVTLKEDAEGRSLLEPCTRAWLDAFVLRVDEVLPRDGEDHDAIYTCESYRFNSKPKVRMRRMRRQAIVQCLRFWRRTQTLESDLLDRLETGRGEDGEETVEIAWAISRARRQAWQDLERFSAVPTDCDMRCRCRSKAALSLPKVLIEQTIDLVRLRPSRRSSTVN